MRSQQLTTNHGRRRKCPPKALHDNTSPTRRWRRPLHLHWAVALMPRQRRRCGMPAVIQFDTVIVVFIVIVVIQGLHIICFGHFHLSRCTIASLVAPLPLSPRCRHYCRANACLIAPLSRQRLVVATSPLLPCQCLSCPLLLRRRLSCGASLAPGGCHFANYLDVPPSLFVPQSLSSPPLSLRRSLFGSKTLSTPVNSILVCLEDLPLSIRRSGTRQKASCGR